MTYDRNGDHNDWALAAQMQEPRQTHNVMCLPNLTLAKLCDRREQSATNATIKSGLDRALGKQTSQSSLR
jgi:hypothetical protein